MTLGFSRHALPTMAFLALVCHLASFSLSAAPYAVTRYSIGSGGISGQGAFAVTGTLGQPAIAVLSGGDYQVAGGFWPRLVVSSTIEVPRLLIQWIDGALQISWTPALPGFRLEQTDDPSTSNWSDAPTGNPLRIPPPNAEVFYRLRGP